MRPPLRKNRPFDRYISNNVAASHGRLLQSSPDQFCNLHMGLQDGIYDGWDNRFFYNTNI
jgi:hypothetical protein